MLILGLVLIAQGNDALRDFVVTKDKAYIMLAPDVVCGPEARELIWSADGKSLAVVQLSDGITRELVRSVFYGQKQADPKRILSVITWTHGAKTARKIYSGEYTKAQLGGIQWLGNSSDLVAMVRMGQAAPESAGSREVWLLRPDGVRVLYKAPPMTELTATASPTQPMGAIVFAQMGQPEWKTEARLFDHSGLLEPWIPVGVDIREVHWGNGGSTPFVYTPTGKRDEGQWMRLDRKLGAIAAEPNKEPDPTPLPIRVETSRLTIALGEDGSRVTTVKLVEQAGKSEHPGLVTSDGGIAEIAPDCKSIAYTVQGAVFVRELVEVPKEAFLRMQSGAVIGELASKGKQVATAMQMFMADNDDSMPSNSGWQDKIKPYLKDPSVMQGFNYTFQGGPLPPGADPKTYVIGFLTGPGGRANVYWDSSVRWEKG